MHDDYIPRRDNDFLAWHDRFNTGVGANGATFGLSVEEIADLAAKNALAHMKFGASATADDTAMAATAAKRNARRLAESAARSFAQRITVHPACTDEMRRTLGILGAEAAPGGEGAPYVPQPVLKGKALAEGGAQVSFEKRGFTGVKIYCQREGQAQSEFLAVDTSSPYVDNRALLVAGKPEVRKYKAIFMDGDETVGDFSAEISVTCSL
jgi:hypothetical protein